MDEKKLIALEELKLLSEMIGRIENPIYMRQNWLITVLAGLIAVLFYKNGNIRILKPSKFLILSLIVTFFFFVLEILQRIAGGRAIKRSTYVQQCLRENISKYEGPNWSSISKYGIRDFKEIIKRIRFFLFYLLVLVFILACYFIAKHG